MYFLKFLTPRKLSQIKYISKTEWEKSLNKQ